SPERRERDRAGPACLDHQQRGDEEAREHEEDVDAQETAAGPTVVVVVRDDREHGSPSQAVECGVVAETPGGLARAASTVRFELPAAVAHLVNVARFAGYVPGTRRRHPGHATRA